MEEYIRRIRRIHYEGCIKKYMGRAERFFHKRLDDDREDTGNFMLCADWCDKRIFILAGQAGGEDASVITIILIMR